MTLRLLWLIDSLTMGGAETLAVTFARKIRDRGIDLTVCARTSIGGNPLEAEIRAAGVEVITLGARNLRDRDAWRRLLRVVRERRIEVIHAHLTYAAIWGALAARRTGVPLVATLHVPPVRHEGLRAALRERILVALLDRYASRVVVVSEALRRAWESRLRRLDVIHNGIELPARRAEARRSPGVPVITAVAVLREGKGIDVLIDAAREVRGARFVIVGDGPLRGELERKARGLPIAFEGFRRDVSQVLAETDLFVHPTLADAFPTVLLEAMAAGLPVIASDVGGVPEIVDAPRTALLVPPGDARALAAAMSFALGDGTWRAEAGAAGRGRVERELSADRWVDRLARLYTEVVRR